MRLLFHSDACKLPTSQPHLFHFPLPQVALGRRLAQRLHAPHRVQLAAQPLRAGRLGQTWGVRCRTAWQADGLVTQHSH